MLKKSNEMLAGEAHDALEPLEHQIIAMQHFITALHVLAGAWSEDGQTFRTELVTMLGLAGEHAEKMREQFGEVWDTIGPDSALYQPAAA